MLPRVVQIDDYMFGEVMKSKEICIGVGYEAGIATGLAQGLERGMEQGIARGLELTQGLEQGQYNTRIENAKAMLADNMDMNLVAKYVGLPVETIKAELG